MHKTDSVRNSLPHQRQIDSAQLFWVRLLPRQMSCTALSSMHIRTLVQDAAT